MAVMLGMASVVISAGQLYLERRQIQEVADAAALAGAAFIPCSGDNAYAAIDGLVSQQLGATPVLAQTPGGCGSSAASWSRTYPDGTQVTATYPYEDTNHVQVSIVSPPVPMPLGRIVGSGDAAVAARAVGMNTATAVLSYALYVEGTITCNGASAMGVNGSIYSGGGITGCAVYAHAVTGFDQGSVTVYPSGQAWLSGGGSCSGGVAKSAICADGFELSGSSCPVPGITDFLGGSIQSYPCPNQYAPAPSVAMTSEPNADTSTVATIGGVACDPSGQAAAYPLLYVGTTVVGRLRPGYSVVKGVTVSNAPYKDTAGYYHVRPGCYGWLDVSRFAVADSTAKAQVVFDPGFYYFSGYFQPSDGDPTAGGLCLDSAGAQALGQDVTFEFTSNVDPASFSTGDCAPAPSSSSSGSFGADPATPITVGGVAYGSLSAPCNPSTAVGCPVAGGSSWCPSSDAACTGILIWAPAGPPVTTLPQVDGTFFVKGTTATAWLYGAVFWPGQNGAGPGCQWAANGTTQITGSLVCDTLLQQGGKESNGPGIFSIQLADVSSSVARTALTE